MSGHNKGMKNLKNTILVIFSFISLPTSALNLAELRGETRQIYRSPRGVEELCVISKKWPGGFYRKDDVKKESTLCSYDFHTNIGICPKYTSTNPAILLLAPNERHSKKQIDASSCVVKAMDVEQEAKFKQSISCSYTPSILAYYHISRALGEVARIPTGVIRTMDIRTHADLTAKANEHLRDSKDLIKTIWAKFAQTHLEPQNYPLLYDESQTQIYGALIDNVKREEQYIEVSGLGSYETRYQRFLAQKPFERLTENKSVSQMLGTSEFAKVAQTVVQMKDVSDMVLLDQLLSQQDRIGNIHYKLFWYYIDPASGKLDRKKSNARIENGQIKIPEEESRAMVGRPAVVLKEMVLKDNDCGVIKRNMMKEVGALEKIRHFSYQTYRRFLQFEQDLNTSAGKEYFTQELLFTPADYAGLVRNAQEIKNFLVSRCTAGQLRFDVDLESYVPGAPQQSIHCQ